MRVFLIGCTLLTFSLFGHLILWKIRLPKRHTATLLGIFCSTLVLWTISAGTFGFALIEFLHSSLFFVSLSLCYVITYSAVEGDSPTLSLMGLLAENGSTGSSRHELDAFFVQRPFVRARLAALLQSSLIRQEKDRYFLAGKPSLPFRLILGFRKVFGSIPKGG